MQVNKPQETDDETRMPACMVLEFHNIINAQNSNKRLKIVLPFFTHPSYSSNTERVCMSFCICEDFGTTFLN